MIMCFWNPLMLKQTASDLNANLFPWTPLTQAAVLFIYPSIFHDVMGKKKKTGASKNCQFLRLSHRFSILCFLLFLFTEKEKRTFMSVCSGTESLVCFSHWGCSSHLFFRAVWKTLIGGCGSNNMEGRRWMVTLPRMSEIQVTSIQGATELRIIAIAPLRGRTPSSWAFFSFHLSAVSSRKKQQRKVYSPTLSS